MKNEVFNHLIIVHIIMGWAALVFQRMYIQIEWYIVEVSRA